ncbi:hypothetical protein TNCV_2086901 [Trichonephila clavipes]|nr:hypothetical protein TNCV_2086901 [Trichonephila clavipes]
MNSPSCIVMLTAVPLSLGSNLAKDMDVCKCIVSSRHEDTLNTRRAASPLVWLVEEEERWQAFGHSEGFSTKQGSSEISSTSTTHMLSPHPIFSRCHSRIRPPPFIRRFHAQITSGSPLRQHAVDNYVMCALDESNEKKSLFGAINQRFYS